MASFSSKPSFGRDLDERAVAVIACVGLFEELNSGWEAAASVFEESFAFTLPGIFLASLFYLYIYYNYYYIFKILFFKVIVFCFRRKSGDHSHGNH